MTEAATIEAPVAAPAAPVAAPAAPESLFTAAEPAAAPGAAPAAGHDWLPEKYRVSGETGVDLEASAKKLADGYAAAVKRIGTGDLPPESPDKYTFTMPEALKEVQLDADMQAGFKDKAHKAGLTQQQFEFVMGEYLTQLPAVLDAGAKHTAEAARAELAKVWTTPADMQANMAAGQKAIRALPADIQKAVIESGLGTNPVMARVLAEFGKEMREDRSPAAPAHQASSDVETLMRSDAYRNPKHPEHAAVSARVADIQRRRFGDAPAN